MPWLSRTPPRIRARQAVLQFGHSAPASFVDLQMLAGTSPGGGELPCAEAGGRPVISPVAPLAWGFDEVGSTVSTERGTTLAGEPIPSPRVSAGQQLKPEIPNICQPSSHLSCYTA